MAKMQRPAWTIAFGIICVLVIPGTLLTHISVGKLIPSISDLPVNIIKGFDEVFKFAYLEKDSDNMKKASVTALKECDVVDAALTCPNFNPDPQSPAQQKTISTTTATATIKSAFANSLSVVNKIANDKYFGTPDLKATANNLNKVTVEMDKIQPSMKCYAAIPTFCNIWTSSDGLVQGMAQVNKALDAFKTSDIIKQWDDNKSMLTILHALPYFLVIAIAFFACFWCKGGVCCCCRGGSTIGSLALIPSMIFWLAAFVIYTIVMATGIVIKFMSDKIEVPVLQGKPTLDLAIAHIQNNYSEFWNVVFLDMAEALDMLLLASYFFVAACLLHSLYSCCEMCCCPYRDKAEKADAEAPAAAGPGLLNPPANADAKPVDADAKPADVEAKPADVEAPADKAADATVAAPAAKAAEAPVAAPAEKAAEGAADAPFETSEV